MSWLLVWIALVAAAPSARAGDNVALAKKHFEQGELQYRQGEFREALASYKKALGFKRYPAFLFNIAQCHRQLREYDKALFFYRLYLSERPNAPNKAEVERRIREMESKGASVARPTAKTGRLSVVTKPPGAVVLVDRFDGKPLGTTPVMLPLSVGSHLIRVQRPGFEAAHRTVTIKDGEITLVEIRLEPTGTTPRRRAVPPGVAPPPSGEAPKTASPFWKRWWFWTGVGTTVALTAAGLGLMGEALSRRDKWLESYLEADKTAGERARTGADVCAGLAAASAIATLVGAIVVGRGQPKEQPKRAIVAPSCSHRGCAVWVTGRF